MASVTFPVAIGGDGSTVSDDSNVSTGLANGGHRTRFVPALGQLVAIGNLIVPLSQNALNAPGTSATSSSSNTIGTGTRIFVLDQAGKSFAVGQWVQIASVVAPAVNYMVGAISGFSGSTMTVEVVQAAGSGTISAWAVHPATPIRNAFQLIGSDGSLAIIGAGGLGYGTGAGISVTQTGSKSSSVSFNKRVGRITMHNAALAGGASVTFSMINTTIGPNDIMVISLAGGFGGTYRVDHGINLGGSGAEIRVTNITGGSLSEAVQMNFALLTGAVA
jgi:hypothetical protein